MQEIKIRYTVRRQNGFVFSEIFTLEQIEKGEVAEWIKINYINTDDLHKDIFTSKQDKSYNKPFIIFAKYLICSISKQLYSFLSAIRYLIWAAKYLLDERGYDGGKHEEILLSVQVMEKAIKYALRKTKKYIISKNDRKGLSLFEVKP
jgi:hypothetical protein